MFVKKVRKLFPCFFFATNFLVLVLFQVLFIKSRKKNVGKRMVANLLFDLRN